MIALDVAMVIQGNSNSVTASFQGANAAKFKARGKEKSTLHTTPSAPALKMLAGELLYGPSLA